MNFPVHEGGLSAPRGVCVYFSYGIPETVEWVHHGESFYIGEIKITGGAMPCPACSQVKATQPEYHNITPIDFSDAMQSRLQSETTGYVGCITMVANIHISL